MRSKSIVAPIGLLVVIVLSIPVLQKYRSRQGFQEVAQPIAEKAPATTGENGFPDEDLRVSRGTSNVWEVADASGTADYGDVLFEETRDVFVLLKTGAETMWDRVPVHFDTTFKRYPFHAIYSDLGSVINGHEVIDVLQFLPEVALNSFELLGYRARRANVDGHWGWGPSSGVNLPIEEKNKAGWLLDRFKNIPAYIHAWQTTKGAMKWYFMIDGDTYMTSSTFAEAIRNRDPDDIWYLGKAPPDTTFAHGGSGILMSRGAMKAMFHNYDDYQYHEEVLRNGTNKASDDCCGDSVFSFEYERLTGKQALDTLEHTGDSMFQGNSKYNTKLTLEKWCTPVGSFHHISAYEAQELFQWENIAANRKAARGDKTPLSYADFYEDMLEPFLTPRHEYWSIEKVGVYPEIQVDYTEGGLEEVFDQGTKLDPVSSETDCSRACELKEGCLMWEWEQGIKCRLSIDEIALGIAYNEYHPHWKEGSVKRVVGHMVDRIKAIHEGLPCKSGIDHKVTPGWYYDKLSEAIDIKNPVAQLKSRPLNVGAN